MNQTPRQTQPQTMTDSSQGISGKKVLVVLAVFTAVLMAIGWMVLHYGGFDRDNLPRLSWKDRTNWPIQEIRPTGLEASAMEKLGGATYRNLSLKISEHEEQTVQTLAKLAASPAFTSDATRQQMEAIHEDQPDLFYASYLLATWHRIHGNSDEADDLYQQAFLHAPRAIQQQYITPRNRALPNFAVGRIDVICYRSNPEHVDKSLRLVFPHLVTSDLGYIYLPLYDTVYSIATRTEPPGYTLQTIDPEVFQFPGRIGSLRGAMVHKRPQATAPATQPATP